MGGDRRSWRSEGDPPGEQTSESATHLSAAESEHVSCAGSELTVHIHVHVSINATCIHFSRHGTVTGASVKVLWVDRVIRGRDERVDK